jgi:predicted metal-dependent hydrolase
MQLELAIEPPPTRAGSPRRALLGGGTLWYSLVRARRRTLSIVVDRSRVEVRAPRWTPINEIERFLADKEPWIRRRIDDARRGAAPFAWRDGEQLPVLGETLRLALTAVHGRIERVGDRIEAGVSPSQLRAAVLDWLRGEARRVFAERVALFVPRLGVRAPDVRLSNARTQWGSCSARGRILLNWRLVHMPIPLIDYVVAHELSHLRELNHSPRFWTLVGSLYPAYEAARAELERLGRRLPEL